VSTLSDACIISKKVLRQERKHFEKNNFVVEEGRGCYLYLQYYSGFASRYDSILIVISPKTSEKIAKSSNASTIISIKHFIKNCMEK